MATTCPVWTQKWCHKIIHGNVKCLDISPSVRPRFPQRYATRSPASLIIPFALETREVHTKLIVVPHKAFLCCVKTHRRQHLRQQRTPNNTASERAGHNRCDVTHNPLRHTFALNSLVFFCLFFMERKQLRMTTTHMDNDGGLNREGMKKGTTAEQMVASSTAHSAIWKAPLFFPVRYSRRRRRYGSYGL